MGGIGVDSKTSLSLAIIRYSAPPPLFCSVLGWAEFCKKKKSAFTLNKDSTPENSSIRQKDNTLVKRMCVSHLLYFQNGIIFLIINLWFNFVG